MCDHDNYSASRWAGRTNHAAVRAPHWWGYPETPRTCPCRPRCIAKQRSGFLNPDSFPNSLEGPLGAQSESFPVAMGQDNQTSHPPVGEWPET